MKTVSFPDGAKVPALGQGTWRMGESQGARKDEVEAVRLGIELGLTLIDTAEMYGDGGAEEVVAEAIAGQRDHVFVVTKVYPYNASLTKMPEACERSLKRLRIDVIDLYLVHWRQKSPPLAETVEAFEKLRSAGKIKRWGVSNFDAKDMKELFAIAKGSNCAADQVLYNLEHRAVEVDLMPWCRKNSIPIMAYSPLGHGRGFVTDPTLKKVAQRHDATAAQIALAWLLHQPNVITIPKASTLTHVRDNARSIDIELTKADLEDLERQFPAPRSKQPLAVL
ncbi:MAG TPA: aldo/keto reductase [Chthoniobacterales bacterium]|jgi:diketogulonate reductase-like aldo/keto reductase|nr:aldo/keto reductase [Chthoniobacterales bacterium]